MFAHTTPRSVGLATILVIAPVLQAGLIGHWSFDESSGGMAADAVGSADATWQNGASTNLGWSTGQIGGAVELGGQTGGSNFFSTGNLDTLSNASALTIAVWINPDGFTGSTYEGIFMTRSTLTGSASGNQNWGLAWEDGNDSNPNPHLDSRTSNGIDSNPAIQPNNGWYHVALVWDGVDGTHTNHINGIQTAFEDADTLTPTGNISGGVQQIGNDDCCGGDRDFDNALTGAQINSIYQNGLAGLSVPEPSSVVLVLMSGALAFGRRR